MALYTVRSPFNSTAYLGVRDSGTNRCQPGTVKYWHVSPTYDTRGFDIASTQTGSADPVYARIVNGVGVTAGVYARSYTCGVDIDIRSVSGNRRLRYYHVDPTDAIGQGGGNWVLIGTIGAYGSISIQVGTVYASGSCAVSEFPHVHIDTLYRENAGSGDHYDWINCTIDQPNVVNVAISSATSLFYL